MLSYAGIAFVLWQDFRVGGNVGATMLGGMLVFVSAIAYALYLVGATDIIGRLGSSRFIAWAMLVSTICVLIHFALTRPLGALKAPASIHRLTLAMAVFSTVLPTWLIAESIRRMDANAASLVGSLGPVFTIGRCDDSRRAGSCAPVDRCGARARRRPSCHDQKQWTRLTELRGTAIH